MEGEGEGMSLQYLISTALLALLVAWAYWEHPNVRSKRKQDQQRQHPRRMAGVGKWQVARAPVPDLGELLAHEQRLRAWVWQHVTHDPRGISRIVDMHMEHHGRAMTRSVCGCQWCRPDPATQKEQAA